jgi:hypothetical protein
MTLHRGRNEDYDMMQELVEIIILGEKGLIYNIINELSSDNNMFLAMVTIF